MVLYAVVWRPCCVAAAAGHAVQVLTVAVHSHIPMRRYSGGAAHKQPCHPAANHGECGLPYCTVYQGNSSSGAGANSSGAPCQRRWHGVQRPCADAGTGHSQQMLDSPQAWRRSDRWSEKVAQVHMSGKSGVRAAGCQEHLCLQCCMRSLLLSDSAMLDIAHRWMGTGGFMTAHANQGADAWAWTPHAQVLV